MKYIYLFLILLFVNNCTKPKTSFICGDHKCVNKDEANQYFNENMTLEVRVLNKNKNMSFDLVKLNTTEAEKKEIKITRKPFFNKKVKELSENERKNIIKEINKKKKIAKLDKKINKDNELIKSNNKETKIIESSEKNTNISNGKQVKKIIKSEQSISNLKDNKEVIDICSLINNCEIDEISKYLIKKGSEKDFPDISSR